MAGRDIVIRVNGRRLPRWGHYLNEAGDVAFTRLGVALLWIMCRIPGRRAFVSPLGKRFGKGEREITFDYDYRP